jgi:hypothetical protein
MVRNIPPYRQYTKVQCHSYLYQYDVLIIIIKMSYEICLCLAHIVSEGENGHILSLAAGNLNL